MEAKEAKWAKEAETQKARSEKGKGREKGRPLLPGCSVSVNSGGFKSDEFVGSDLGARHTYMHAGLKAQHFDPGTQHFDWDCSA
jgi:hypothetical protein